MSIENSLNRATIFYKAKKFTESIVICQKLLAKKPKLFPARQLLALNFQGTNQTEQAIVEFTKAVSLNPKHSGILSNFGNLYLGLLQFDVARKYFLKAIDLDSTMSIAINNLAICQENLGDKETAMKNYKKAILLDGKAADFHLNLGSLYTELGEFDLAMKLLVKSLELDPKQSSVYYQVYTLMMYRHQYQDALEVADMGLLSNALSDIELCELLVGKAMLYWLFDNVEEAAGAIALSEGIYSDQTNYSNIQNLTIFHRYLKLLIAFRLNTPDFYQNQNQNQNQMYFISESHCFSSSGATVKYKGIDYQMRSRFIRGTKIFHLINEEQNKYKVSLATLLKGLPDSSKVVLGFGEIDCRNNEGIFKHCIKTEKDFHNFIEKMLNNYIELLQNLTQENNLELIVYGVPAPHPTLVFELELSQQAVFKAIISHVNLTLAKYCKRNNISFLDVYKLTSEGGVSNLSYHIDLFHVKPETIAELFNRLSS
jgi:tetratricopeptide (TPR) repeat protein